MKNITTPNKSWSFRSHTIQWNFLMQTATSLREGFPKFQELTPSSFLGWAGGLIAPKLISLGAIKLPAHPEYGDVVSSQNFRKPSYNDTAVCTKKFCWILWLWKLQDLLDVVIFFSLVIILTPNGNFWMVPPWHSVSYVYFLFVWNKLV